VSLAWGNMDNSLVFAILIVISVMAVILLAIVEIAKRFAIPWHVSVRSREKNKK
jgi:NitT/TauT family transport system permease protein